MNINDYKAALKNMIDVTEDEVLLKHWKTVLESSLEQDRQERSAQTQHSSAVEPEPDNKGKDDNAGYVILESGLGINE